MAEENLQTVKKGTAIGRVLMVSTGLLWGLAGVCVKEISWDAMSLVTARSIISLIMLLVFVKRSFKIKFTKNNILGALAMSATGMLYVQSIKLTTAGTAIVLQYVAPILVFLYAVIFKGRKPKLAEVLITLAVFGGIVLSFADSFFADSLDPTKLVGNLLGLASGVTYAAQIIIMNGDDTDSGDSLIISNIFSLVISLPFFIMSTAKGSLAFDTKNIIWILILGVFQYGLGNILFGKSIQKLDNVEASLILTIEPIFNPIPVAIFYGEMMGTLAIVGAVVVIFFVTLYGLLPTLEAKFAKK